MFEGSFVAMIAIWATLVAFGRIRPPTRDTPAFSNWLARHGRLMKVLGPITIASGLARIVLGLLSVPG